MSGILDELSQTSNFSNAEIPVVEYILKHPEEVLCLTLKDLAQKTFSSEATIMLGIAFCTKNKKIRAEALSVAVGCIFAGVSEPAIYGFALPMKKPLYAVSIGAGLGGAVAALLGARSYSFGYSTILALPIYQDTMLQMAIAVAVTIVGSMVAAMILGFDESVIERNF